MENPMFDVSDNRPFKNIVNFHPNSSCSDLLSWLSVAENDQERRQVLEEVSSQFLEVARISGWRLTEHYALVGNDPTIDIRKRLKRKWILVY
jgi:hypothetical protein